MIITKLIKHFKNLEEAHKESVITIERKIYYEPSKEKQVILELQAESFKDRERSARDDLLVLEVVSQLQTSINLVETQAEQSRARLEKRIKALENKLNTSNGSCTGCHCGGYEV